MKFRRIQAERANCPVSVACESVGVSRSGYYAFVRRKPSKRAVEDVRLGVEVAVSFRQSNESYGSPRVLRDLKEAGRCVSRKRVARLMRERAFCARVRRKFKKTTIVNPEDPKRDNLLARQFDQEAPNKAWVSDLTAVPTKEGWLFIVAFLDLFSRRIVGWRASAIADAEFCADAFEDAVRRRRPGPGLLVHSDRGCQYTSVLFQESVVRSGGISSMSRKGNCWDNAPIESFWSSMKTEMQKSIPETRAEARHRVFAYIEAFYNSRRRHSTLGYVSPSQFERRAALSMAA